MTKTAKNNVSMLQWNALRVAGSGESFTVNLDTGRYVDWDSLGGEHGGELTKTELKTLDKLAESTWATSLAQGTLDHVTEFGPRNDTVYVDFGLLAGYWTNIFSDNPATLDSYKGNMETDLKLEFYLRQLDAKYIHPDVLI
ncbi:hypothetical protein [Microvirga aerophila]|uniref:Uncharacterized protein n=2 Tax=Microvirga aerophila TaxID=670291 RepID=A0A512C576_9HYPH|nr:hypothetical protein [Microvirga aerophila]GEO19207.1 hypothetical protein MAE02_69030 [Microvirga aerophila]